MCFLFCFVFGINFEESKQNEAKILWSLKNTHSPVVRVSRTQGQLSYFGFPK